MSRKGIKGNVCLYKSVSKSYPLISYVLKTFFILSTLTVKWFPPTWFQCKWCKTKSSGFVQNKWSHQSLYEASIVWLIAWIGFYLFGLFDHDSETQKYAFSNHIKQKRAAVENLESSVVFLTNYFNEWSIIKTICITFH